MYSFHGQGEGEMAVRIMIVEDDENVAGLLFYLLRRAGFAADVVRDGRAALQHVRSHPAPAAVVLDRMLPHQNGLAIAAAMRADPGWFDVPILLLSASDTDPGRRASIVDAWIPKPFDPVEVLAILRRLVRAEAAA
jgi:two-component system catabolic regulation response regulator CreB